MHKLLLFWKRRWQITFRIEDDESDKNSQAHVNHDLGMAPCSLETNPMVKNKEGTPTSVKQPAPIERPSPIFPRVVQIMNIFFSKLSASG